MQAFLWQCQHHVWASGFFGSAVDVSERNADYHPSKGDTNKAGRQSDKGGLHTRQEESGHKGIEPSDLVNLMSLLQVGATLSPLIDGFANQRALEKAGRIYRLRVTTEFIFFGSTEFDNDYSVSF